MRVEVLNNIYVNIVPFPHALPDRQPTDFRTGSRTRWVERRRASALLSPQSRQPHTFRLSWGALPRRCDIVVVLATTMSHGCGSFSVSCNLPAALRSCRWLGRVLTRRLRGSRPGPGTCRGGCAGARRGCGGPSRLRCRRWREWRASTGRPGLRPGSSGLR